MHTQDQVRRRESSRSRDVSAMVMTCMIRAKLEEPTIDVMPRVMQTTDGH
jgi:hypothetical protein